MQFLSSIKSRITQNGYIVAEKYLCYVPVVNYVKVKDCKKKFITLINNCTHRIAAQENLDEVMRIAMERNHSTHENNLFIVMSPKKTTAPLSAPNIAILDPYTGKHTKIEVNEDFAEEKDFLLNFSEVNKVYGKYVKKLEGTLHYPLLPLMTIAIIVATVLISIRTLGRSDLFGISADTVIAKNQAYRLFTYGFLHAGLFHLIGNMLSLYLVGGIFERRNNAFELFTVYIFGMVYAGIISIASGLLVTATSDVFTVGASGAVFAVIAATGYDLITDPTARSRRYIGYFAMVFLAGFLSRGTDNACHFGGILAGIIAMAVIKTMRNIYYRSEFTKYSKILRENGRVGVIAEHTGYENFQ